MRYIIKIMFLITFVFLPFIVFVILPQLKKTSGFESGGGMLLSKEPDVCSDLGNRTDCLTATGCGWCEAAGMCMKAHYANQCEGGMAMPPKLVSGFAMPEDPNCAQYKDCKACADAPSCGWCQTDKQCKNEDRWGASGNKCSPEEAFITSSDTCNSRPDNGGPIIISSKPVSNELLGNGPANAVNLASRDPAPVGAKPPAGADLKVAASPEPARRNIPATAAINAPGAGTVASASESTQGNGTVASASGSSPQVASCGTKVSFKLSELPAIEAKIKDDILKVLQSTRA
jgi:hypothetical protein